MYDLDTIKRLNRNPSKRTQPGNRQDKPAPPPAREESQRYYLAAKHAAMTQRFQGQPPAGQRGPQDR